MDKNKKHLAFSKVLLIQESILVWLITIALVILAFLSISQQFCGELPWLVTLVGAVWAAYGVSQAFYYNKSKKENTKGGIKYMTVANALKIKDNKCEDEEQEHLRENAEG